MNGRRIGRPARLALALLGGMATMLAAGCATPAPPQPGPIQRALIGKTKQDLLACAGVPQREATVEGVTVLTYYRRASPLEHYFSAARGSVPCPRRGCEATVELKEDRVASVTYQAVPEALDGCEECDEIFAPCLP